MSERPEIISLLGVPHYASAVAEGEELAKLEANLAEAKAAYELDPDDVEKLIWYGRRVAYLWRFHESIQIYSEGIARFPNEAMLYRHRGHRYISIRDFASAKADLSRAAALQDDDFDIWYHLGLACWLLGDFETALTAYQRCYAITDDDSLKVAITDWLYMTLRRLGRTEEAAALLEPIQPEMEVGENFHYHYRLLLYKGLKTEAELVEAGKNGGLENATLGFGLGCWHLYNDRPDEAFRYFEQIVKGTAWSAFGFISAEAELARAGRMQQMTAN